MLLYVDGLARKGGRGYSESRGSNPHSPKTAPTSVGALCYVRGIWVQHFNQASMILSLVDQSSLTSGLPGTPLAPRQWQREAVGRRGGSAQSVTASGWHPYIVGALVAPDALFVLVGLGAPELVDDRLRPCLHMTTPVRPATMLSRSSVVSMTPTV